MRLWIDTEFNEYRGELISLGIVDEAGREFYEVLPEPMGGYLPWVAQHVVPILNKAPIVRAELQAKLHAFLASYGNHAHLVADWPEDVEHFLHLLVVGPGERIGPDRWTMEVRRDLPSTADTSSIPHNALEDAKALRAGHLLIDAAQRLAEAPCDGKDPRGCWRTKCQLGGVCCRAYPDGVNPSDGEQQ